MFAGVVAFLALGGGMFVHPLAQTNRALPDRLEKAVLEGSAGWPVGMRVYKRLSANLRVKGGTRKEKEVGHGD